jgi:hypothetical protein
MSITRLSNAANCFLKMGKLAGSHLNKRFYYVPPEKTELKSSHLETSAPSAIPASLLETKVIALRTLEAELSRRESTQARKFFVSGGLTVFGMLETTQLSQGLKDLSLKVGSIVVTSEAIGVGIMGLSASIMVHSINKWGIISKEKEEVSRSLAETKQAISGRVN